MSPAGGGGLGSVPVPKCVLVQATCLLCLAVLPAKQEARCCRPPESSPRSSSAMGKTQREEGRCWGLLVGSSARVPVAGSESSRPRPSLGEQHAGAAACSLHGEGAAGAAGEQSWEQRTADAVCSQDSGAAGCFDLILFEGFLAP